MSILTIDTYQIITDLKQSGLSDLQAEAITKLHRQAIDAAVEQARHDYELDNLATKRDLKDIEVNLKKDIEILRLESKAQNSETKAELIRWVVGVGVLQSALMTGLLMKLSHLI
jgi:hypothetical protein